MKLRAYTSNILSAAWLAATLFHATALNAAPPASPAKQEIPQSVFIMPTGPEEGRDPFFPNCNDLYQAMALPTPDKGPQDFSLLKLSGLSRSGTSMFAVINNRSFAVGEDGEVSTPEGRIHLRCIAIDMKTQSVTVQVPSGQRATLFLPGEK